MPHMYVEYSSNLQGVNEGALMDALNQAVCHHPTVTDEADVKTRIASQSNYRIGLNSAGRALHVELRLMAGRTAEVKGTRTTLRLCSRRRFRHSLLWMCS